MQVHRRPAALDVMDINVPIYGCKRAESEQHKAAEKRGNGIGTLQVTSSNPRIQAQCERAPACTTYCTCTTSYPNLPLSCLCFCCICKPPTPHLHLHLYLHFAQTILLKHYSSEHRQSADKLELLDQTLKRTRPSATPQRSPKAP